MTERDQRGFNTPFPRKTHVVYGMEIALVLED